MVTELNGKIFIDAISKAPPLSDGSDPVFVLVWDRLNKFWRSFLADDPASKQFLKDPRLVAGYYNRRVIPSRIDQDMSQVLKEPVS